MLKKNSVYLANTFCLEDETLFMNKLANLSSVRQKKIRRSKLTKDRRQREGAGLLLHYALKEYGIDSKTTAFTTNEFGKPMLKSNDLYFSLSHSGDYVLCAIGSDSIGVDLQEKVVYQKSIAQKFFQTDEQKYLFSFPEDEQADNFFRLWTLRESCVKMLGYSLAHSFSSLRIAINGREIKAYVHDKLLSAYFTEYRINNYFIAVCSKNDEQIGSMQYVDISK